MQKLQKNKNILFAPSYQPERSTNPDGGIYYEHYYALSLISKNIPKNIIIIYKEHPKCFDKKFKNIIYRDLKYFKKIKDNLKNFYFFQEDESSIKLIKHSILQCVQLDTSCSMDKNICFGNAQYENYPNIIKYKSVKLLMSPKSKLKTIVLNLTKLNKIATHIIRDCGDLIQILTRFQRKYDYPTLIDNKISKSI